MDRLADRTRLNRLGHRVGLIAALLSVISAFPSTAQPPDACTPTSLVTVSEGTTITSNDIAQFDAVWMSDACRQQTHGLLWNALSYRYIAGVWGPAERMSVLGRMYELTHQQRYLAELRESIELTLSYRDDRYPGNPDKQGCPICDPTPIDQLRGKGPLPGWGGFGIGTGGKNTIDEDASSLYGYPIAAFARIVAEDPSLQAAYGSDAVRYANAAMQTAWMIMPQVQYRQAGSFWWGYLTSIDVREKPPGCRSTDAGCTPAKLTDQDCAREYDVETKGITDPVSLNRFRQQKINCENLIRGGAATMAHNENGLFMMMLIELWRALDSNFYRSSPDRANDAEPTRALIPLVVSRYQRFLADHLRSDSDSKGTRFYWNYLDLTGFAQHAEDTGHGAYDMLYIELLRRNLDRLNAQAAPRGEPIALDQTYLRRFANTFLQKIAAGADFAFDVTGALASGDSWKTQEAVNQTCNGWANLAIADASVYRICKEISLRVVDRVQPYLTIGNHLALLSNKQFSRQVSHIDLTSVPGLAQPAGDPFTYVFDEQGVQNVVFRGTDGHVHGRWRSATGDGDDDITKLGGGPSAAGNPRAYVFAAQGIQNVVYRGTDGHLHGVYWSTGAPGHDDITTLSRAPPPAGDPFGYIIPWQAIQNVVYRGTDGHLHGLYWSTGAVGHDDLTAATHAPLPAGDPFGYIIPWQTIQNVVYRGTDGHLHGLYWSTGAVGHDDLTVATHAPPPAGDPFGYVIPPQRIQNVVYRGTDGHLHGLYWSTGAVGHDDLTAAANAPAAVSDPTAYFVTADGTNHVFYRSADNHVRELWWTTGAVGHSDLTDLAGAPRSAGNPSAYFLTAGATHHVVYRGEDGHLHELRWAN
jgi:hypothetical protein